MQIKFNNSVFIGGEKNNVNYFYGIRYAQAKRFDLPKLTDKYPSQVNCLEFGNISHQAPNFFKIPLKESEDCLNLNI
jgi:carboxylesterase type B